MLSRRPSPSAAAQDRHRRPQRQAKAATGPFIGIERGPSRPTALTPCSNPKAAPHRWIRAKAESLLKSDSWPVAATRSRITYSLSTDQLRLNLLLNATAKHRSCGNSGSITDCCSHSLATRSVRDVRAPAPVPERCQTTGRGFAAKRRRCLTAPSGGSSISPGQSSGRGLPRSG